MNSPLKTEQIKFNLEEDKVGETGKEDQELRIKKNKSTVPD
jgi:hypothetical protein